MRKAKAKAEDIVLTFSEWQTYRKGELPQRLADEHKFTSIADVTLALLEERVVVGNVRLSYLGVTK